MKHKTKRRNQPWVKDAEKLATNMFDLIIDKYVCEDFVEFHGSVSGNISTYRFYKNGEIVER